MEQSEAPRIGSLAELIAQRKALRGSALSPASTPSLADVFTAAATVAPAALEDRIDQAFDRYRSALNDVFDTLEANIGDTFDRLAHDVLQEVGNADD